ncbi:MAG: PEP-CTERM sorting domain-containing protein [Isosphaeraceae bacterium]
MSSAGVSSTSTFFSEPSSPGGLLLSLGFAFLARWRTSADRTVSLADCAASCFFFASAASFSSSSSSSSDSVFQRRGKGFPGVIGALGCRGSGTSARSYSPWS